MCESRAAGCRFLGQRGYRRSWIRGFARFKIEIVCNLRMGGTNPHEIEQLLTLFGKDNVKQSDTLHSKMYLTHDFGAIGSSNASANGLAFQASETDGWTETNLISTDMSLIANAAKHFQAIFKTASIIETEDIAAAKVAWCRRRHNLPFLVSGNNTTLFSLMKTRPSSFEGREIYIVMYAQDLSQLAKNDVKNKTRRVWV